MEIVTTLEKLSISAFSKGRTPVTLDTSASVRDALKTFNTEKILSCPIVTSTQKAGVHGFLDLFDLLAYLLELWDENETNEVDGIHKLGEKFLNHTVSDLIDRSDNDVYAAVTGEEHAHRLVRLFGLGVHRVALLDMRGSLTNILSQSDVVKFLHANLHLLGENANKTIRELKMIATDNLVVAETDQTAISAFNLLGQNLISAVPIVDKNGVLCGTLALSDLKLIQDDLSPLLLTTSQYKPVQDSSTVCTSDSTLGSVISHLASSSVHRLWVVDAEGKPISVISITNVCEFLSQFLPVESE